MATADGLPAYAARLEIDYTEGRNRLTAAFRIILILPILLILAILNGEGEGGEEAGVTVGASLFLATALMILFRQRYPRWWFDFMLAFNRFGTRV